MKFDIITIFPGIFDSYFNESILKRAQKEKLIGIKIHNLRDWTTDKHKTVDDTPYGGGAGMVMKVEPIYKCVADIKKGKKSRVILFSAKGKKYTQQDAERLSKYDNLILICGRYEGVDERVAEHIIDEEISIGDYVLTGGEIPAMVLVDSVVRLVPGVIAKPEATIHETFTEPLLEYPQYTEPQTYKGLTVPPVLLSGDHQKIAAWRKSESFTRTKTRRPDLLVPRRTA